MGNRKRRLGNGKWEMETRRKGAQDGSGRDGMRWEGKGKGRNGWEEMGWDSPGRDGGIASLFGVWMDGRTDGRSTAGLAELRRRRRRRRRIRGRDDYSSIVPTSSVLLGTGTTGTTESIDVEGLKRAACLLSSAGAHWKAEKPSQPLHQWTSSMTFL